MLWRARRDLKPRPRSEEHTSELQSRFDLVCRLLLGKKKEQTTASIDTYLLSLSLHHVPPQDQRTVSHLSTISSFHRFFVLFSYGRVISELVQHYIDT